MVPWHQLLPAYFKNTQSQNKMKDTQWQGHQIPDEKHPEHTRFMVQNVRGITLEGHTGVDIQAYDQVTLQVDIQAISEHCLDTTKFTVTQNIKEKLRQEF